MPPSQTVCKMWNALYFPLFQLISKIMVLELIYSTVPQIFELVTWVSSTTYFVQLLQNNACSTKHILYAHQGTQKPICDTKLLTIFKWAIPVVLDIIIRTESNTTRECIILFTRCTLCTFTSCVWLSIILRIINEFLFQPQVIGSSNTASVP
jgi:hypothetical protein